MAVVFRYWKPVLLFIGSLFSGEGITETFSGQKKRKLLVCDAQWHEHPPLGFNTLGQARLFAVSILPYSSGREKEFGTIIYKKNVRFYVAKPNVGSSEKVGYKIGRTKQGRLVTIDGGHTVIEMVHTHPNDGRRGNAWFSASRLNGQSDVATAENLDLNMSMRFNKTLRLYDPRVEDHTDTFGNLRWHKGTVLGDIVCP